MIPGLDKIDPVPADYIHEAMLLGYPPGPDSGPQKFQGFRLT
jgi:hypothetical protein